MHWQRTADAFFDIGVFLNIEPDHIGKGEHATFSEYLYCKSRLMRQCGIGIVNQDDPNVDKILAGHTCEVETFSIRHPSDVMAEDEWYEMGSGSLQSHFTVKREWRREVSSCSFRGSLISIMRLPPSVAGHFKVDREQIKAALAKQIVPGRCQNMTAGTGYVFLIDYAHNEMSLRNLLETLRKFEPARLIVIFGCGGNRSVLRMYQMGETAGDWQILPLSPRIIQGGRIRSGSWTRSRMGCVAQCVQGKAILHKDLRPQGGSGICRFDGREKGYYCFSRKRARELSGDQRNPISVRRQKNSTGGTGWRSTRISLLTYSMKN